MSFGNHQWELSKFQQQIAVLERRSLAIWLNRWINGWGLMGGHSWRSSYDKISCCFMLKNAGLQESTLSNHCITTGFELLTCGLLQRGWDYFPPKVCFSLGAELSLLAFTVLWIYNSYKQNRGRAERWSYLYFILTRGMGEPMYGRLL